MIIEILKQPRQNHAVPCLSHNTRYYSVALLSGTSAITRDDLMYADLCYAAASSADSDYAAGSVIGSSDGVPAVSAEERNKHMIAMFLSFARQIAFGMVSDWLSDSEVYLTPNLLGARSRAKIPDLTECQGLDIKVNHLFHIQCAIFSVITKSSL